MENWTKELLEKAEIIHLATIKADGAPALRRVNFLFDGGKIYLHSGPEREKIAQVARDPRVCLELAAVYKYVPATGNPCTASYGYRSIVIEGTARVVEDGRRKQDILQKIMGKYQPEGGYHPVSREEAGRVAVVEIEIRRLSAKEHIKG